MNESKILNKISMVNKPRIAIYDFTDCEGCEVKLVSLREKILDLEKRVDIVDWRLGQERKDNYISAEGKPFLTAAVIEGTPITQHEIDTLKYLRENSALIIALGACACVGGIPGIITKSEREKWNRKIYGENYNPKGVDSLPLEAYVKVDYFIHGCPADSDEIARVFEEILAGKKPSYRPYSVCYECKLAGNKCRIVSGQPCLGPITQGGCGAICVSGGSPCYGCFGKREDANVDGLLDALVKIADKKEIEKYFTMYFTQNAEYQEALKKRK